MSKITTLSITLLIILLYDKLLISCFNVCNTKFHNKLNLQLHMKSISSPTVLNVDLGERSYPIYIGQDMLQTGEELRRHVTSKKALIVTNTKIGPLYSNMVRKQLEEGGIEVHEVILPDGEEYKNMDVLMMILDKAMNSKFDRKSTFVALGGGVVGDMTGFAAAIFQRGVKFIQIPTTLMAMVDSAVGGKTAVNHPNGKNMIGAFYQPDCVIIDTNTLNTLPDRELRSGISEVVKYGLIRDANFFQWQENNMQSILDRNPLTLAEAIQRSCENKAAVVAADEREGGIRATLNLGHTFGHAIEAGMGYGVWLHGEAVAAGMVMAADMSAQQGWIDTSLADRARNLLEKAQLPVSLENNEACAAIGEENYMKKRNSLSSEKFLDLMSMDKKVADGQLSLILLSGELGRCEVTNKFDPQLMAKIVKDYTK